MTVESKQQQPASLLAARVIVDELVRLGCREAVVCPGSRSAPLARALFEADAAGWLRLHVRIDERAAAFLATGLAAESGAVTPVVTTSGSAVANLLPAFVEAQYSAPQKRIPVLALTADRPASYAGVGANQTITQAELLADAVSAHFDLDATATTEADNAMLRARVCRLVAAGLPAHLNVRFVEPLVPNEADAVESAKQWGQLIPAGRPRQQPWTNIEAASAQESSFELDLTRKTLVIAGSGATELESLAEVPTIAEPDAFAPTNPVHPLAAVTLQQIKPEQIVVLGRPTLHRPIAQLLADKNIEVTVVAPDTADLSQGGVGYPDVTANARRVVSSIRGVGAVDKQWQKVAEAASQYAVNAVRETLQQSVEQRWLSGLHVAAAVTDSLRTGDALVLGASNAVRDASWMGLPFAGVDVIAGRGAAGIDGTIARAIGHALVRDRRYAQEIRPPRTIALLGDLTFLHDAGALAIGPGEPRPENLTIVVANDTGGGIFETLEPAAEHVRNSFERIFGTPQDVDIAALCQAYDVAHVLVDDMETLLAQLHPDTDVEGIRVVEVTTARDTRRELHQEMQRKAKLD